MYRSTIPVPTGTVAPTITFSVTPLNVSTCPSRDALAIVGTVISNAARARTDVLVPAIPVSTDLLQISF